MARINISQILMKRGNTTAANTYVGPLGELVVDTGLRTVRVQDGATAGGMSTLATNVQIQTLSNAIANISANTGGLYSNANVAAYLTTRTFYSNANVESYFGANLGSLWSNAASQANSILTVLNEIDARATEVSANVTAANLQITNLWSNAGVQSANIVTLTANASSQADAITALQANLGSTQIWANANVASITANIGSFYTYANLNYGTSSYANANVAAYLTAGTSLIPGVTLPGNVFVGPTSGSAGVPKFRPLVTSDLPDISANISSYLPTYTGNIAGNIVKSGYTWTFSNTGTTTFPTGVRLSNARGANTVNFLTDVDKSFQIETQTSATSKLWNFTTDGNLTLPQNANINFSNGVSILAGITGTYSNANVASYLPTYSGAISANIVKNGYTWTFGTDGALTLPASSGQIGRSDYTNGIDLYNNNGGTGYVRMNYADESVVWADSGGAHVQTNGANTWDFGTDANLTLPQTGYLRVGTGIVAGFASSPAPVISGFSNISAENFTFLGNGVNILSTVSGNYGNANVAAYLTTATITTTGNITAGNISGAGSGLTGVALKTTGSWTVATGTNTYSFTVPVNGVYQLWVECNIPNGILAYNATATVSNSNVPVVGAQYAWVYTGGGTPIDFTSIPNQFTGTGNAIVRSSVAPSATTNRFDFGINNTSGSSQTAYWGYVRLD